MVMVAESVRTLKCFLALTELEPLALGMVLRMVLALIWHRGRMSCSAAAGSVASEAVHRGELTRFLARPRWQKIDFNAPLRKALLAKETQRGRFIFIVDATLVSQAGAKTQNTHSQRLIGDEYRGTASVGRSKGDATTRRRWSERNVTHLHLGC